MYGSNVENVGGKKVFGESYPLYQCKKKHIFKDTCSLGALQSEGKLAKSGLVAKQRQADLEKNGSEEFEMAEMRNF